MMCLVRRQNYLMNSIRKKISELVVVLYDKYLSFDDFWCALKRKFITLWSLSMGHFDFVQINLLFRVLPGISFSLHNIYFLFYFILCFTIILGFSVFFFYNLYFISLLFIFPLFIYYCPKMVCFIGVSNQFLPLFKADSIHNFRSSFRIIWGQWFSYWKVVFT